MPDNLAENFLYELLPEAVISRDELGYIEALTGGFQDCLEDLRSAARKLSYNWEVDRLKELAGAANCVLVKIEGSNGVARWRSLDFEEDTPEANSDRLRIWAAEKLGLDLVGVREALYGYDPFRQINPEVLARMAATLGAYFHHSLLTGAGKTSSAREMAEREAQARLLETWFPRLRIKGTEDSFVVLGRLLGLSDLGVVPLWSRLCVRRPENSGFPENRQDFASFPDYLPPDGPLYDAADPRDGPYFAWTGTVHHHVEDPRFYTQAFNGVNPWLRAVIQGTLNGTNLPAVWNGTVIHPSSGSYTLSGGGPLVKASVAPALSSVRFEALVAGERFNGLSFRVDNQGSLAIYTIEDRLSSIKYRSRYYDVYLWLDEARAETLFGRRAVEPNTDLARNPGLTGDGTAAAPYYAWSSGSVRTALHAGDWIYYGSFAGGVSVSRRPADSAAPYYDCQFNLRAFDFAGAQVLAALEEVRPATRQVLNSRLGIQYREEILYALHEKQWVVLDTQSGTTFYSGTVAVPMGKAALRLDVEFPGVWLVQWSGVLGRAYRLEVSYNGGPWAVLGVFTARDSTEFQYYDYAVSGSRVYAVYDESGQAVPLQFSGSVGGTRLALRLEKPPALDTLYEVTGFRALTNYQVSGYFDVGNGVYQLQTPDFPGVRVVGAWKLLDTEVVRPEPSGAAKAVGNVETLCRPEDDLEAAVATEFADELGWDRSPVIGGVDLGLSFRAGTLAAASVLAETSPVYPDLE